MASILLVTHARDRFHQRSFLVGSLFERTGPPPVIAFMSPKVRQISPADLAFLHVDATAIPSEYVEALARYPIVVNGRAGDVSKRAISKQLVARNDGYQGQVIVKTDRNSGGYPEALHAEATVLTGGAPGPPVRYMKGPYPIYDSPCLGARWGVGRSRPRRRALPAGEGRAGLHHPLLGVSRRPRTL